MVKICLWHWPFCLFLSLAGRALVSLKWRVAELGHSSSTDSQLHTLLDKVTQTHTQTHLLNNTYSHALIDSWVLHIKTHTCKNIDASSHTGWGNPGGACWASTSWPAQSPPTVPPIPSPGSKTLQTLATTTQVQPAAVSPSLSTLPLVKRWRCPASAAGLHRAPVAWWSAGTTDPPCARVKSAMLLTLAVPTRPPTSPTSTQHTTSPAGSRRTWTPLRTMWLSPFRWGKSLKSPTSACSSVRHVPSPWPYTRAWTMARPGCPTSSTPLSAGVCTIGPTRQPLPSRTSRRLSAQMATLTSILSLVDSLLSALWMDGPLVKTLTTARSSRIGWQSPISAWSSTGPSFPGSWRWGLAATAEGGTTTPWRWHRHCQLISMQWETSRWAGGVNATDTPHVV